MAIFFSNMPQTIEKELFTVIVHENQFVVSARRIYDLLQPPKPYQPWVQQALYSSLLKENEDYFFRPPQHGKRHNPLHHVWVTIYTAKTLCTTVEEEQAKEVFSYCTLMQQRLMQQSLQYIGYYVAYSFRDWRAVSGQRLYPLGRVLQALQAVPATELKLRKAFPQHITQLDGKAYISSQLCRHLHFEKWTATERDLLKEMHPFTKMQGGTV